MFTTEQLENLRRFYRTGASRSCTFRIQQLKKLRQMLLDHEKDIYDALQADLHKSREEVWVTEIGMVLAEINQALRHLKAWMEPVRVRTNLANLPSSSFVMKEPLGVVLIIGPWNYPVQLLLNPLVGALAAGNCVVLKPSEYNPATAALLQRMVAATFSPEQVLCVPGEGAVVVPALMEQFRFDHVFFTGSTAVGRLVYRMAADKLVPVTLELGGKSPCIVEADANITVAAKRICLAKFSNAGQMCVAPDYVLVHATVYDQLLAELKKVLQRFFGDDPSVSGSYGRLVNTQRLEKMISYLSQGTVAHGGRYQKEDRYLEPTLLTNVSPDAPVMQEEIFGPILPVLTFRTPEEALKIIEQNPNPLAFYVFTSSKQREKGWLESVAFGGGCVNNTAWHLTNHHLPFGGRGASGTGRYHGKHSFDTFTHEKSVMKTPVWPDPAIRYPPFKGKLGLFKKLIR